MKKIWLSNYPKGIPAESDPNAFGSLRDMLQQSCLRYASLPAFSNMGSSISFDELDRTSRDFAAYLQGSLGLILISVQVETNYPRPSSETTQAYRVGGEPG